MNYNIIINTILYCDVFYNILIITNNKNICKSHNNSFISHELRNPLQTINFSNNLMQKKNKDESIKKYINISAKAIYDMTKIINDILDMDRIENNKLNLTIENINIADLMDNINFEFNSYIINMNISFKINVDINVPHTLFTDSTRTKQIIINLLINSLKYTKINKINNILLNVLYNEHLKYIEFNIIDNGIGIKESDIVKILQNKDFNIKKTPLEISEGSILKKSTKEGIVPEILGMILS
jgi:signal transduction histidine kinase